MIKQFRLLFERVNGRLENGLYKERLTMDIKPVSIFLFKTT